MLRYQIGEIDAAGLTPGEEEDISSERARLMHADRLRGLAESAIAGLDDMDGSASALLGEAKKAARDIAAIDPSEEECERLIDAALASAGEACGRLRAFAGLLDADPDRLSEVEGRLDTIARLKKKYGPGVSGILEYRDAARAELASLESGSEEAGALASEVTKDEAALLGLAREIGAQRRAGASGLADRVKAELSGLGMGKAAFSVDFEELPAPGPRGIEKAEFKFSANPGERPKPLVKVASGGELSRVMLALKVVLASADGVPTLIFDEVDTGVGGSVAAEVGRKLREAAAGRQVLCITHLPQVASAADAHFVVEKAFVDGGTRVTITVLDGEGRVREVARMLGGEGSKTASAHAEELVRQGGADGQA